MRRFFAVFKARNLEFFRDRAALAWNIALPVLLVLGFAFVFKTDKQELYTVGVYSSGEAVELRAPFGNLQHIRFVPITDLAAGIDKVKHYKLDLLIKVAEPINYWVNSTSPNGYFLEQLLLSSYRDGAEDSSQNLNIERQSVSGREIRYVDWVLPGILAVNMMFSSLWGIGYVIVRYRKNHVLRRLKATPLSPLEFLTAQVASRLLILLAVNTVVFLGCDLFVHFNIQGSLFSLFVVFLLGAFCLICLGLLICARIKSEELSDGILNLISWPMMLSSGMWFSLEGAAPFAQKLSLIFPLTHVIDAARAVMNDGATLSDVSTQLGVLAALSLAFLTIGSVLFRWE